MRNRVAEQERHARHTEHEQEERGLRWSRDEQQGQWKGWTRNDGLLGWDAATQAPMKERQDETDVLRTVFLMK